MNSPWIATISFVTALLVAPPSAAQGSDACGSAQPISGTGQFAFDNTAATTDGLANGCEGQIERDLWFDWIATQTGTVTVQTCGLATIDTKLAAYAGGTCPPASPVAWNDDSCGDQSRLYFPVSAGSHYLIRLGVSESQAGGVGQLSLSMGSDGGCVDSVQGPDLALGDLTGVRFWGSLAETSAYSFGLSPCNLGDHEIQWQANTNQHPVFASNAYRLEHDRFEQIGMSWLMHGFAVLSQNLCCDCIPSGTVARLGVGCSDTTSSGLTGSQQVLAPRSEVDPWRGQFPYPFDTLGETGDVLYKRLQIENDELDPALHPSASYFAELQAVAPDDAAAGNGANNASWRELEVGGFTGEGWNLTFSGSTQREAPALRAWQVANPQVRLESVQAPCDGNFWVASLATDNGDGTWHYEYAIQNLNSTRGAQAYAVPLAAGATVTGVGFHDVAPHSGEPYSDADWSFEVLSDRIEWSTDEFSVDPNANALRWGTLYNFRFDCDVAPREAPAVLTFFAPETPLAASVTVQAPSDECGVQSFCLTSSNSVGAGARIGAAGSTSFAANDFALRVQACPPSESGLFFYGPGAVMVPFGNGWRCVGGGIVRLQAQRSDDAGSVMRPIDYGDLPQGGQIQAGDTWYFQYWYRDPMGGGAFFNLSDGLEARFCP